MKHVKAILDQFDDLPNSNMMMMMMIFFFLSCFSYFLEYDLLDSQ